MSMRPRLRKLSLTAHVTSSIGWFGAVAAFLALALAGLTTQTAPLERAAYLAMALTTWFVIVPLALVSVLSGVLSSLGTRWGLVRYYWVVAKILITIVATFVLLVHLQPIDLLAGVAVQATLSSDLHGARVLMVVASGAALLALIVLTALSVYKPQGITRYWWRQQQRQRKALLS